MSTEVPATGGAHVGARRTVAQKMGIKPGSRAYVAAAPASARTAIAFPPLVIAPGLDGEFDYLHLFTTSQHDMDETFPALTKHLAAGGMLWVSWPKARKLGTDLSLPSVIRIGYSHGLVESTCLSVDTDWSALTFTRPRPGVTYHNSHDTLPTSWAREASPFDETAASLTGEGRRAP